MPISAGITTLSSNSLYDTFTVPVEHRLGQMVFSQIMQGYKFSLAGAVALTIGNLIQSSVEDTQNKDMAVQAAVAITVAPSANGGYPIPVTLGSTATVATTDFAGGTLSISVTPGLGQTFTILANDIASGAATCNFYVLEQPLVALTTSSKATAYHSEYWKVVQMPGPKTARPIGGAVSAIGIANYGFIQVLGAGTVLSDATATAASTIAMSASAGTAGAATKGVNQDEVVGHSLSLVSVSAESEGIHWLTF